MRDENNDTIPLKNELYKLKQFENVTPNEFQTKIRDMTPKEVNQLAPIFTLGRALKQILSTPLKEQNNEQTMEIFKFIDRINHILENNKGVWNAGKDEIKKVREFLDLPKVGNGLPNEIKPEQQPMMFGQILTILETAEAELIVKSSKKD